MDNKPGKNIVNLAKPLAIPIVLSWLMFASVGHANSVLGTFISLGHNGLSVSAPNGYATVIADDLAVQSVGGKVTWERWWDGENWQFNSDWESLSTTWENASCHDTSMVVGSFTSSDSSGSPASGTTSSTTISLPPPTPSAPAATVAGKITPGATPTSAPASKALASKAMLPFNQVMVALLDPLAVVTFKDIDPGILSGCLIQIEGTGGLQGIRRQNELYFGKDGHFSFDSTSGLTVQDIKALPTAAAASLDAQLADGQTVIAPVTVAKGYRWLHKDGRWMDYNPHGQMVAYGDNNTATWLARDSDGLLHGVVDNTGRVLLALHYTGGLLTSVSDYPVPGNGLDLPARTVTYQYDGDNRLVKVTDARGNATRYDYDAQNHLTFVTDQEGHFDQLAYTGNTVSQVAAADGAVTDFEFGYDDANHQYSSKVTGPATAAGRRVVDTTYNDNAKPVRRVVNDRTDDEASYDGTGRTESHTNARGFTTTINRNEFKQVTRIDYPDGTHVQRSYSAQNQRLTETVDEAGVKAQYGYDGKGNRTKKTEAVGTPDQRNTEYEVNGLGQTTQITRKGRTEANNTVTPDAVWLIEYDGLGQVSKATDPEGGTRRYVFDRAGNLAQYTDPLGHGTRYEADADGNLLNVTDAEGRSTSYGYDKAGNPTGMADARGKATQASYDAMNRLLQATSPVGGTAKLQYDSAGLPTKVTDEDSRSIQLDFDNFHRLAQIADSLGNTTQFAYTIPDGTATGKLGSLSLPNEVKYPTFSQDTKLDPLERPTHETLHNPNHAGTDSIDNDTSYDVHGWVKSEKDSEGKLRTYEYNAYGDTTAYTDNLGNKTAAQYDARGNLIQLTDANGNSHQFSYDRNDRLTKETLPLGQETDYGYDAAGNLSQTLSPNGHKTTYSYDKTDWLVGIKHYTAESGNQPVRTTTLTWDDAYNLSAWTDTDATRPQGQQTASSQLSYDDDNRKLSETVSYPNPAGQAYSLSYGYQYTLSGDKKRLTWADGTHIDYGYSGHGELKTVTIPNEGILSVSQYNWTQPSEIILPGGTIQQKGYDGLLNLESLKVKNANQQPLLDLSNSYSKRLELTDRSRTDTVEGQNNTVTGQFSYDDESRLTQSTLNDTGALFGSDTESFTLDGVGNRTAHGKLLGDWAYDANNRLTEKGILLNKTTYGYDDNGNLTAKTQGGNTTHYRYDSQNRLIEVTDTAGNPIARYGYDPFDRRIWKEAYRNKDGAALSQPKRSYYLYGDEGLIAESQQPINPPLPPGEGGGEGNVTATTAPTLTSQYGPRPDGAYGTATLFIKTKDSQGWDTVAYYHHDHLGTPIQATDRGGNIIWSAQYAAFGKANITTPTATQDKPTIESNLRFPGQVEDAETGLYYNWHRYYDPDIGRYVTADPIGLEGGINLYAYVNGDPVNLSDPSGEFFPIIVPIAQQAARMYAQCLFNCMRDEAIGDVWEKRDIGCIDWKGNAKECAVQCLNPLNYFKKGKLKGKNDLHRPYIRKSTRKKIEERAQKTSDGRYRDANTRKPFEGKYDLGHKYGREYRREQAKAEAEGLSQKEFNERMNDPDLYQIENPSTNRGHKYEKPGL